MAKKNISINDINSVTKLLKGKNLKSVGGILVVLVMIIAFFAGKWFGIPVDGLLNGNQTASTQKEEASATTGTVIPEGEYDVERCVDGDTILLTNKIRLRLIGANTPETVKPNSPVEPFGPEASKFTKQVVAVNGNKVRITYDGTKIDRYGRTLVMVWLGDTLLNELLIQQGLAKAELQYSYSKEMKDRFQKAENQAKQKRLGIWSQST